MNLKLALVVIEEDGAIVVQSLTEDVAAQGATITEALESFARVWEVHQDFKQRRLHDMSPAPAAYWDLIKRAAKGAGT